MTFYIWPAEMLRVRIVLCIFDRVINNNNIYEDLRDLVLLGDRLLQVRMSRPLPQPEHQTRLHCTHPPATNNHQPRGQIHKRITRTHGTPRVRPQYYAVRQVLTWFRIGKHSVYINNSPLGGFSHSPSCTLHSSWWSSWGTNSPKYSMRGPGSLRFPLSLHSGSSSCTPPPRDFSMLCRLDSHTYLLFGTCSK